ncbi:uncharacterized protein LOC113745815 [Larimichthys crocea]|uniref:uncharacterized protein LOC113745815 n=1 Tax=Larimichthys crocea TaxID=215358 RepID=UPI000F5F4188|nr:uncharacterized protein LOC113745815 [Larimichthys crocea]
MTCLVRTVVLMAMAAKCGQPLPLKNPATTPSPGISVCVSLLIKDEPKETNLRIFNVSSSRSFLILEYNAPGRYNLHIGGRNTWGSGYIYTNLLFKPHISCLSNVRMDNWTRLCLTVDTVKNVAQVSSGSKISFSRILPNRYVWSGEPVKDLPGFDGQGTNVQIWDYSIGYIETYNYMTGVYGFSPRGNVPMEDVDKQQEVHPTRSAWKRSNPIREKAAKECSDFKRKLYI